MDGLATNFTLLLAVLAGCAAGWAAGRERLNLALGVGIAALLVIVAVWVGVFLSVSTSIPPIVIVGVLVASVLSFMFGMRLGEPRFRKTHVRYAGGAVALAASYVAGTFAISPFAAIMLLFPLVLGGLVLVVGAYVRDSPRLVSRPAIGWWISTLFAAVAGFIAGWSLVLNTVFSIGGFDAYSVITGDYGISAQLLDYLILVPAVLLAAAGAGLMGIHCARRTTILALVALVALTLSFFSLVAGGWYTTASEEVGLPGAAVITIAGLAVAARMLAYSTRGGRDEPLESQFPEVTHWSGRGRDTVAG